MLNNKLFCDLFITANKNKNKNGDMKFNIYIYEITIK